MSSNGFPRFDSKPNKDDAMFDRNRDRSKRKHEDKDGEERRSSKGRKSDSYSRKNRYEQEETNKQKDNTVNSFMNNGPGNTSDGSFQPPLPPMPPPQNQMGNMGNQMAMMGNMMGMMGNMNMMGGMMNPMAMMGNMGNMANMGTMSQFGPMMPPLPAGPPEGAVGMMQTPMPALPGQGQMMPEFMNVFQQINTREPIDFVDFRLYPPPPNAPTPSTRDRPPGCKTIFVGGLPENFTETQLAELFVKCGEIHSIRLSTKRFAHIRYMSEMSVDIALYFSGYRIRIHDLTDGPNTGRLHIDFALARDDQYEFECQQRLLDRERRHQERMIKEQFRVPSPPVVVHYSDHEAASLSEKLKNSDTFRDALEVICTWLERGECSKRNAATFYSLLQSTNSHVRHLVSEKASIDEELQRAKDLHVQRTLALGASYGTIEKVFLAASQKKVWDHFSKAQRKSIDAWKKAASDIKALMPEEDDMDTDSEDEAEFKKKKQNAGESKQTLKDDNDSLRCQLEAYKNEIEILKLDMTGDVETKDKELQLSRKLLENVQGNLMEAKLAQRDSEIKTASLQKQLLSLKQKLKNMNNGEEVVADDKEEVKVDELITPLPETVLTQDVSEIEAKLIGLISIFLHIHPFGASVEYIWSYVQKFAPSVKSSDLETCMGRFPTLFKQAMIGIGANIERRWKYAGINE